MTSLLQRSWNELLRLSEQMLKAAHNSDWQRLAELEGQRSPLIQEYFLEASENQQPQELSRQISWLQGVEQELLSVCLRKRDHLSVEIQELNKGKTAGDAYLSNAASG